MGWTVRQRVTVQTKNVIMSKAAMGSQQVFFFYIVRCSDISFLILKISCNELYKFRLTPRTNI